jgi:hypothetical protein
MRQEIQRALTAIPFVPFAVVMSDGARYVVSHPENAMLTESGFYIHLGGDETVRLALLHITQVAVHEPSTAA